MRAWTDHDLLDAWERGLDRPVVERALALLAAADLDASPAELAGLSVGRRDARLLDLHAGVFGPRFVGIADCPACGLRLELELNVDALRAHPAPGDGKEGDGAYVFETDGCAFRFRLPDSRDVAAAAASDCDDEEAARRLLECCLLSIRRGGQEVAIGEIPETVVQALIAAMAEADPQADVRVALACPGCRQGWLAGFDILAFFWAELHSWASGLLREVHTLASAYGWSEPAILALSPRRRRLYLEILRG